MLLDILVAAQERSWRDKDPFAWNSTRIAEVQTEKNGNFGRKVDSYEIKRIRSFDKSHNLFLASSRVISCHSPGKKILKLNSKFGGVFFSEWLSNCFVLQYLCTKYIGNMKYYPSAGLMCLSEWLSPLNGLGSGVGSSSPHQPAARKGVKRWLTEFASSGGWTAHSRDIRI